MSAEDTYLSRKRHVDFAKLRRSIRERSNSALRQMKLKNIHCVKKIVEKVEDKLWDGYQWVNKSKEADIEILKAGNLIQVANLPLYLGITSKDLEDFLVKKAEAKDLFSSSELKRYKKDLIYEIELDKDTNSAIIYTYDNKAAERFLLLNGITLLGHTLSFSFFMPTKLIENTHKGAVANANSADISAKSAAIAYAALESYIKSTKQNNSSETASESNISNSNIPTSTSIEKMSHNELVSINKDNTTYIGSSLNISSNTLMKPSRVIKVMNVIDDKILKIKESEYIELKKDMFDEFSRFGTILQLKFIARRSLVRIGAEIGSLFIKYEDIEAAEKAYIGMKGIKYDDKLLRVVFIDEKSYDEDIMKNK
jgi:hypothetical protein